MPGMLARFVSGTSSRRLSATRAEPPANFCLSAGTLARVKTTARVGVRLALGGLVLTGGLGACSSAPGNRETDRIAKTVATAISWPRRESANALALAAVDTRAGQDGRLTVIEAEDLEAEKLTDPLARLVFRVHLESEGSGFGSRKPITACYSARFSYYGIIDEPARIDCPAGAPAVVPTTPPPTPDVEIPANADRILKHLLAGLPAALDADDIRRGIARALPSTGVNAQTGLRDLPPVIEADVFGSDVGVALWDPVERSCLMGARLDGVVTVWRPAKVYMQPGELGCDPGVAHGLGGLHPPH
jgi:hypothetical protein